MKLLTLNFGRVCWSWKISIHTYRLLCFISFWTINFGRVLWSGKTSNCQCIRLEGLSSSSATATAWPFGGRSLLDVSSSSSSFAFVGRLVATGASLSILWPSRGWWATGWTVPPPGAPTLLGPVIWPATLTACGSVGWAITMAVWASALATGFPGRVFLKRLRQGIGLN